MQSKWIALIVTLISAACTDRAPTRTDDTLIDNITGYSWRGDSLEQFAALRFNSAGQVVATYGNGDIIPYDEVMTRIDANGATLLPGLIDAHGHVLGLGQARNRVDLVGTRSIDEALQRIEAFADAHPDSGWILGRGWNQVLWAEGRFPTAADLDALGLQRPIWLSRIDGHASWANSLALAQAGIDAETTDPAGGRILRDQDGNATGVLVDTAEALVDRVIPAAGRDELRRDLLTALNELASLGITSVHDAGIDLQVADLYRELNAQQSLPIRAYGMLSEAVYTDFGPPLIDDGSGHLAIQSVKVYLDGALGSRGAALIQDYADEPGNTGLLFKSPDEFARLAASAERSGFQVNVHAIGDAANRVALDGFATLDAPSALRHRIEHAQVIALDDIPRFATLGVIASVQPTHATSDKNMAEDRVGPDRIKGAYAWRRLLDAGARIAAGSDFPVEPANPLYGLHAAVTRQDRSSQPPEGWYPEQRLTAAEALKAFTIDAAYAARQEDQLGTLEPGKQADFILLDRDLFSMPAQQIWQANIVETWVRGRRVYPQP